jgi:hypothetical protein
MSDGVVDSVGVGGVGVGDDGGGGPDVESGDGVMADDGEQVGVRCWSMESIDDGDSSLVEGDVRHFGEVEMNVKRRQSFSPPPSISETKKNNSKLKVNDGNQRTKDERTRFLYSRTSLKSNSISDITKVSQRNPSSASHHKSSHSPKTPSPSHHPLPHIPPIVPPSPPLITSSPPSSNRLPLPNPHRKSPMLTTSRTQSQENYDTPTQTTTPSHSLSLSQSSTFSSHTPIMSQSTSSCVIPVPSHLTSTNTTPLSTHTTSSPAHSTPVFSHTRPDGERRGQWVSTRYPSPNPKRNATRGKEWRGKVSNGLGWRNWVELSGVEWS